MEPSFTLIVYVNAKNCVKRIKAVKPLLQHLPAAVTMKLIADNWRQRNKHPRVTPILRTIRANVEKPII